MKPIILGILLFSLPRIRIAKPATLDIDKFFKEPVSKPHVSEERQLANQMQDMINLLAKSNHMDKKPKKKEISLADKLNMLDNFEHEANKIKKQKFADDDDGQQIFEKTKRKLLQTLSDRKLDVSICKWPLFFLCLALFVFLPSRVIVDCAFHLYKPSLGYTND